MTDSAPHNNVIVIGVDFSNPSRQALHEAIRIGRGSKARLVVVHFLYDEEMSHFKRWRGLAESDIIAGRKTHLETWLSEFDASGLDLDLRVGIGHPFAELSKIVISEKAKLLVLGAQGENHKLHGEQIGSVAKSCLRHPSTDLLLVRKEHRDSFQNVLAAIDFSKDSKQAVHRAAEVARSDGADLHVVHIFSPVWKYYGDPADFEDEVAGHISELRQKFCDFAYSELKEVKNQPVHFDVRESISAYHGILEYGKEVMADLVVIGRLGKGTRQSISPGRTAERVIEKSSCSVLVTFGLKQ